MKEASRHPPHEFARRLTAGTDTSKKAAGIFDGIVDGITAGAKVVGKYAADAGRYVIKNHEDISAAANVVSDLANTGAAIAGLTGLITPDTNDKIQGATGHIQALAKKYGKKEKKKPDKSGSGWSDYIIGDDQPAFV